MVSGKTRIKFYKKGKLKFISHLDLIRTFRSAFARAGVPIWYTEGFNPRPKMVFSLPIPVGVESSCEYLDIRLTEECDEEELKLKINSQFTHEMQVIKIYKPESELSDIVWSLYNITIYANITPQSLSEILKGPLLITKKSKKGMIEVDLSRNIKNVNIETIENGVKFSAFLGSSSENFVNPEHLIKALCSAFGEEIDNYKISHEAVYTSEGKLFE